MRDESSEFASLPDALIEALAPGEGSKAEVYGRGDAPARSGPKSTAPSKPSRASASGMMESSAVLWSSLSSNEIKDRMPRTKGPASTSTPRTGMPGG
jgi:hypothetical protein